VFTVGSSCNAVCADVNQLKESRPAVGSKIPNTERLLYWLKPDF
jgi:hypothetical protein